MTPTQITNVKKWIKLLRSGKYSQGRGNLARSTDVTNLAHSTNGISTNYCCLGVLCETMNLKPVKFDDYNNPTIGRAMYNFGLKPDSKAFLRSKIISPYTFKKWTGMTNSFQSELAELNDLGKSFKVIANIIKEKMKFNLFHLEII